MIYSTKDEALKAVEELDVKKTWTVLSYDELEIGLKGLLICSESVQNVNVGSVEEDEEHVFQWPMFDKVLTADCQDVSIAEFYKFMQDEPIDCLELCDHPRTLKLGLVSYRKASEGIAIIRRTRLTEIKSDRSKDIMDLRDKKIMESKSNENGIKLAAAVQGALKNKGSL